MLGKTWGSWTHKLEILGGYQINYALWFASMVDGVCKRLKSVQGISGICGTGTNPIAAIGRPIDWHSIELVVRNSAKSSALNLSMAGYVSASMRATYRL